MRAAWVLHWFGYGYLGYGQVTYLIKPRTSVQCVSHDQK
jgi:hypothetical protein